MIANDYLSLWEVAHRWHGVDPNKTVSSDLPIIVQDTLRHLCGAVLNGELHLYIPEITQIEDSYAGCVRNEVMYFEIDDLPTSLQSCTFSREYDKSVLDQFLISRHNLFERSIHGHGDFPAFWEDEKLITDFGGIFIDTAPVDQKLPKPNSSLFDQSLCQAIAKTLWDIHPSMTIEAMTKHPAILKYGNGGLYKGKNTLRDWLSPVAPERVKKPGRPRKSESSNDAA